jgi:hypothetical protein
LTANKQETIGVKRRNWSEAPTSAVYRECKFIGRKYSAVKKTYRTGSKWWQYTAAGLEISAEKTLRDEKAVQNDLI